jgi:PAS domain S-box-containing protein
VGCAAAEGRARQSSDDARTKAALEMLVMHGLAEMTDHRSFKERFREEAVVSIVRDVLGIQITQKRRPRLQAIAAQFLLGIAGLALVTFVCFQLGFGLGRTAFAYVILIALLSLFGSFTVSVVLSIVAAACLNYFFAPPLFELRIDVPEDIERIAAFLTTSLVVTALTTKLRTSEARFRTFVDRATDAFFLLDDKSTVLDVNRQACDGLGYSREELIGKHRSDFDVGLDEASIERLRRHISAGETVTFETCHRRKDGTSFPVEVRVGQFEQGGRRFLCLVRDITERKRAEDELSSSEERFRTLVQFSFDVYWETDAQHRFTRTTPSSDIGKTRWEVPYLEPDAEAWRRHRETLDAHLPFRDFELARPTPDGGKLCMSVSGLPVFDKAGRFVGYRGVGRNITERKRAEEALRRSEAYLAEAQRLSHTGTTVFNATGPVYFSEESYRLLGLDPQQGLPDRATVLQRIHPDDRDRVDEEFREASRQKRGYAVEFRVVLPDGTLKVVESTGYPLLSADGELIEMLGTTVDVTERRRAQEQSERLRQLEADLAHMNRLGIMGELTASLAHEILHPIATARNNARAGMRFLDLRPPDLGEVREALGCIVRDADRAKDIVGRIRDHIKKAPPRKDRFDLNEAINEVIGMVQSSIDKNRVSVRTRLMNGLIPIRGDRVQLQQVVLNLILNAVEAMSSVEKGARKLSISTEEEQTGGVRVVVSDSGPGIDPAHLERIFNPFYTTKTSGIGMGLSICRSIIDAHEGRLWADANQPRGAVFQFTLPAVQEGL